jgi:hypothetical protein
MPDALINSYELAPVYYDVILIDEGQDFKPEYWLAIEMLRDQNEDTILYIFQDSNQAIYTNNNDLPIECEPLILFDNSISRLINTEKNPEDIAIIIIGSFHEAKLLLKSTKNSNLWAFKEFCLASKVLVETAKRFKGLKV